MKSYYLSQNKTFNEVEVLKTTSKQRLIKYLEGVKMDKTVKIHPDGVAWGNMYPRLFKSENRPSNVFFYKGRILVNKDYIELKNLIPETDIFFKFQPKTRDIIDCINANEPVLLTGEGGSGKTTTIEQLASKIGQPVMRINFSIETRISDLLGKVHVKSGKTYWTDGVLPYCMKNNIWLILDEIDAADPSVLMLLHPVLEDGGKLILKENEGECVNKSPMFRIFGTANTIGAMKDQSNSYNGTNDMNGAFIDRWTVIKWPNLTFKDELKVLKTKVGGLKHRTAVNICKFAQDVREKNTKNDFPLEVFSTRLVLKWGKKTALLKSPIEGAKIAWMDKIAESEHAGLIKIFELYFGKAVKKKKI